MLVRKNGVRYRIPDEHPFALSIEALAKDYSLNKVLHSKGRSTPERNDVKQLWRQLSARHKSLLQEVSVRPGGATQQDLESALSVDWQGLRGVHNGLARICDGLGIEKPVRVTGYNSRNRTYHMDPDVCLTIRVLVKRANP